jgi:tetratricopeptide (TPR) repeat protein
MRAGFSRLAVVAALTSSFVLAGPARAADVPADMAKRALELCKLGRDAATRDVRERHFQDGLALAERAVGLDDRCADAHFAVFCNLGESLRLDGEQISSYFEFRRMMSELDATLALEPDHAEALASKGILLVRLPRLLGGDAAHGEELLKRVIELDPRAVSSRLTLAEQCRLRGETAEAAAYAQRALAIASEQGRTDKVAEAQSLLAKIESD